jgi:hypothetical protein
MKLYDRDYSELLADEYAEWQSLQQQEVVRKIGTSEIRRSRFRDYPKAARHFIHLFPNNYLDIIELKDKSRLTDQLDEFHKLLDSDDVTERKLLNFINQNCTYFIIASILKTYFHFGHHEAYLFPEFQLGNSYKVDNLLIGKNSDGWHFVFVELEAPVGDITLKDGELGSAFRKGLTQVADWDIWLEAQYGSLVETFDKYRRIDMPLPREFMTLDKSRIHYVVIAGRRADFKDKTYRIRRKKHKDSSELLLHYDNLIDTARNIIGSSTY